MRIDITFKKDAIRLPISTNQTVQGLIYHALREDKDYSTFLHQSGKICDNRKFKLFTFSELKGKYEIEGRDIVFASQVNLSISSADPYFIQTLFTYFSKHSQVKLGDNCVEVADVFLRDNHIFNDTVTIKTLSPITVYVTEADRHTTYFSPDDPRFYDAIIRNAKRKWLSHFCNDDGFYLEISQVENSRYKKCATRFKDTFITAWHGTFELKAPSIVLDFLCQTGLGSKNSQGFGMFEPIE